MDILEFGSSSSESEEDELAAEAERKRLIAERRTLLAEETKRRKEAAEAEEARRFPKVERIEPLKFGEILTSKLILLDPEPKTQLKEGIPRIVEHFSSNNSNFADDMKKITNNAELVRFVNVRHESVIEGASNLHELLVKFQKEVIESLRELTSIPKNEVLYCLLTGNVFVDARERALKRAAMRQSMEEFAEKARLEKLRQEAENTRISRETARIVDRMGRMIRSKTPVNVLTNELAQINVEEMRNPIRDTSPRRAQLSSEAMQQLAASVEHLLVNSSQAPREVKVKETAIEKEEDDTLFDLLMGGDEEDQKMEVDQATSEKEKEDEEEPDHEIFPEWKQLLEYEERKVPTRFGRRTVEESELEWRRNLMADKHKKKGRRVRFLPFTDPRNRMRFFVQANAQFFPKGDDGPNSQYVEVSLADGWKELAKRKIPLPLVHFHGSYEGFSLDTRHEGKYQPIVEDVKDYMRDYHGNLLGRFWFHRNPEYDRLKAMGDVHFYINHKDVEDHEKKINKGLMRQYTEEELGDIYTHDLELMHDTMRRGTVRMIRRGEIGANDNVLGVLLLTDWRLAHLNPQVLTNVFIKYLPTNLGTVFFSTLAEFLTEVLTSPNLEVHTIIFAFGGAPGFREEEFLEFWKKLTVRTLKSVDVFWMAQDWWDGLAATPEQWKKLQYFNNYVSKMFETMEDAGLKNYHWYDIREKYKIPYSELNVPGKVGKPDTQKLDLLYFHYINHFVNNCNCYVKQAFFEVDKRRFDDYSVDEANYPHRGHTFHLGQIVTL